MKIVIAPDSFKESLSAIDVAAAIATGLEQANPAADITCLAMADGGEGTLEAIVQGARGEVRHAQVVDALGRSCQARWGWLAPSTAVIEMASAAGLEQIAPADRDILRADTHGVGQLVKLALDAQARTIVLTAGGSATNDGGAGMLRALGLRLFDAQDQPLEGTPQALSKLARLDPSTLDSRLAQVQWIVATDVNNPLCGPHGASAVFGPQKGASSTLVAELDRTLSHFADLSSAVLQRDDRNTPGAGAGGGLGYAAIAWLGASVQAGAEMVADLIGLEQHISQAELVITGEGRMDAQTLHGKAPMHVIRLAQSHGIPVIGLAGSLGKGYETLYEHGLSAAFSLTSGPMSLEQACVQAPILLQQRARDIMQLIQRCSLVR